MSTPRKNNQKRSGLVFMHRTSWLRINVRDGRIFLTISKSKEESITIMLNPEEALLVSQYLLSSVQDMFRTGVIIGKAGSQRQEKPGEKTAAPRQEETEDVGEE